MAANQFGTVVSASPPFRFVSLKSEYQALFNAASVTSHHATVRSLAAKIAQNRQRYENFVTRFSNGIPWYFIALIHSMEKASDIGVFKTHLHNGDPLTRRTVQVPAGRPPTGNPPFAWEESAEDAIRFQKYHQVTSWSVPRMLFLFETFNGFGHRRKTKAATPYVWSFTNHYIKGKFVADGMFDENAVSRQCGAAATLRQLVTDGTVTP